MDLAPHLARLLAGADAIAALARGLPDDEVRWKPAPAEWSILEVVCHLHDEERDDFRTRVRLTLEQPGAAWPPIDPERWPAERRYLEREPAAALEAFLRERRASLAWLAGLAGAAWTVPHRHPSIGALTAADLLAAWQAHDLLHLRQLTRLRWQLLARREAPIALEYAGGW